MGTSYYASGFTKPFILLIFIGGLGGDIVSQRQNVNKMLSTLYRSSWVFDCLDDLDTELPDRDLQCASKQPTRRPREAPFMKYNPLWIFRFPEAEPHRLWLEFQHHLCSIYAGPRTSAKYIL